jgi:tetratricopeptide (TPR) repeat protein
MKTNDLSLALKLINKSLEIKETYYGYFMKGEIQLLRKEYEPALESFNKASAYSVNSDQKVQLMSKQCVTYHFYGQLEKSNEIFNELLKIDPGFKPDLSLNSVDFTMLVPVQVKDKVARALDYYKKGNLNAALKEFLESLQIKETAIANRYAGEILIRQNDKNAMILLLRAYPDYKNDLTFLYNLCMLNLKYKNSAEAQNIMYRIKQLNPNSIYIPRIEKLLQPAIN